MMRFAVLWSLLLPLALLGQGCSNDDEVTTPAETIHGSGNVVQENRAVGSLSALTMSSAGSVLITQGDEESLMIRGDDNLLPHIITEIRNETLVIRTEDGIELRPSETITFFLVVETLENIVFAGAGDLSATDLNVDVLSVIMSGAATLNLVNLEAEELHLLLSGAGGVFASGTVAEQSITLSGVGSCDAGDLASSEAEVQITGEGSVTVRVSDRLVVIISGVGSVSYIGNPTVDSTITGIGTVTRVGG